MPDVANYVLAISSTASFRFSVAAKGDVTSLSAAADGSHKTLTFNTIEVKVVHGAYTGTYWVSGVDTKAKPGTRTFVLMPGVANYVLAISSTASFRFHVAANGDVSDQPPATGGNKTLTFNTTTMEIDPGAYTGTYYVSGVDNIAKPGRRPFDLRPGVGNYVLAIVRGVNPRFSVDADGEPDPHNIPVEIEGVTFTFLLTKNVILTVGIDIKPGEFPNSINPKSRGKIWVAILSTATFDATTVDPATVRFGKIGTEAGAGNAKQEDADQDGDVDFSFQFQTQETGIQCGHIAAMIKGSIAGGQEPGKRQAFFQGIEGSDSIETVGCKEVPK